MHEQSESRVTLGTINGVYGIKGWVKVYSSTDPIENILNYKTWKLIQKNQELVVKLTDGRKHGKGIVAKFEGINDRNRAEELKHAEITVSANELPELLDGEYYWRDLEGLEVVNTVGKSYGFIDHMMPTVANDVMVVKDGTTERLIPFIQGVYVLNVDLDAKIAQVDWPEDF